MKFNRINLAVHFFSTLLIAGLTAAVHAQAASLDNSTLPGGSNWYIHVNLDLIRNSEVGQQLMQGTMDEALEDIRNELGIDLRDEIQGVTVFGGRSEERLRSPLQNRPVP